jgi:hypothetical protein
LEAVTAIEEDVFIEGNYALTSLSGLYSLNSIGGNLQIGYNDALTSLTGLDNVSSIGITIWIYNNYALTNLTGLDNLASIGGDLCIGWNHALISLTGLENVDSIGGYLKILYNNVLTNLMGLDILTYIGGNLDISFNDVLNSITALDNLTFIGESLWVEDNNSLTSLTGLDNVDAGSIDNLTIFNNNSLASCEVQSICNYLASPNGTIEIHDNATGCNSQEEVEEACGIVSTENLFEEDKFTVSPNPFTTITTLSYTLNNPYFIIIRIFNSKGKQVDEIRQDQPKGEQQVQWNAEGLPAGMYYFRIQAGDQVGSGKMVKIE